MKLLLLKNLLQRRARDEGFTLPMVIALGLVMILLGTTNIVKSSEENLNAISQNSASDALAIAEVGVTKYRELLNQNRILTVYNHAQWTSNNVGGINVVGQACTDMTSTPTGWEDGGTSAAPSDTTKWWEIQENIDGTAGDETIGSYRLISYIYDNDNNTATDDNGDFNNLADVNSNFPTDTSNDNDTDNDGESDAKGILTIQGRSTDGSEAQIQVEIPLRINQDDLENLAPALWIGSTDSTYISNLSGNLGTINIPSDSNIVLSAPASAGSAGCSDPADIGTNSVISDARNIPSIASIAGMITEAETGGSINSSLPTTPPELGNTSEKPYVTPPSGVTFDKDVHCKDISDCRYYYKLDSTTDINSVTTTDGIAKVTLYVNGNLNINRNISSAISSNYLEIYVTSAGDITIDSNNVDTVNALIHAPESQLTINGTGTVNIKGSVWVDKFVNNATVNFETDTTNISSQTSVPSYELYSTTAERTPRPLTSSPTNWIREEVE